MIATDPDVSFLESTVSLLKNTPNYVEPPNLHGKSKEYIEHTFRECYSLEHKIRIPMRNDGYTKMVAAIKVFEASSPWSLYFDCGERWGFGVNAYVLVFSSLEDAVSFKLIL